MSGPRTFLDGGIMNGGPLDGKIMAYGGPAMPAIVNGKRVGTYAWDEDHWEYDPWDGDDDEGTGPAELYP